MYQVALSHNLVHLYTLLPKWLNSSWIYGLLLFFVFPVGLAVDWMNDKVYWSDKQLKAIYSYDLDTGVTSKVVTLNTESIPSKLKIYPQANDEG